MLPRTRNIIWERCTVMVKVCRRTIPRLLNGTGRRRTRDMLGGNIVWERCTIMAKV